MTVSISLELVSTVVTEKTIFSKQNQPTEQQKLFMTRTLLHKNPFLGL